MEGMNSMELRLIYMLSIDLVEDEALRGKGISGIVGYAFGGRGRYGSTALALLCRC
jgi:hypothetical protein